MAQSTRCNHQKRLVLPVLLVMFQAHLYDLPSTIEPPVAGLDAWHVLRKTND